MDENTYEEQCEVIRSENNRKLELFRDSLQGLSQKTIDKHISNVDFYINDYLLYEEPLSYENGIRKIDDFLGYFFIRKCMWSTPGTIKSTAASIKKFYKCMMEHGMIGEDDYQELCWTIKEGMPEWQETCALFNDFDEINPFGIW